MERIKYFFFATDWFVDLLVINAGLFRTLCTVIQKRIDCGRKKVTKFLILGSRIQCWRNTKFLWTDREERRKQLKEV